MRETFPTDLSASVSLSELRKAATETLALHRPRHLNSARPAMGTGHTPIVLLLRKLHTDLVNIVVSSEVEDKLGIWPLDDYCRRLVLSRWSRRLTAEVNMLRHSPSGLPPNFVNMPILAHIKDVLGVRSPAEKSGGVSLRGRCARSIGR